MKPIILIGALILAGARLGPAVSVWHTTFGCPAPSAIAREIAAFHAGAGQQTMDGIAARNGCSRVYADQAGRIIRPGPYASEVLFSPQGPLWVSNNLIVREGR